MWNAKSYNDTWLYGRYGSREHPAGSLFLVVLWNSSLISQKCKIDDDLTDNDILLFNLSTMTSYIDNMGLVRELDMLFEFVMFVTVIVFFFVHFV